MNLNKLFKTQAELDKKIIEGKGLHGVDLLDEKILALQTELGELANEWKGFKFWSENQKARTEAKIYNKKTQLYEDGNPLLEEYGDCMHFILSIGNDAILHYCEPISRFLEHQTEIQLNNVTDQFLHLFMEISGTIRLDTYIRIWNLFVGLGSMLGFTWEQIEQAYYEKNEINHHRQESGY